MKEYEIVLPFGINNIEEMRKALKEIQIKTGFVGNIVEVETTTEKRVIE